MNRCGKLVVAKDRCQHPVLDELLRRGKVNEINLQAITEAEAKSIEPRVKNCQRALFSPTLSTVDPTKCL
jgi:L-2-hydroxyglutarate oxidase LhgO